MRSLVIGAAFVAAGLAYGATAHAVSFDCSKAHSTAETVICNDPDLSSADDELGAVYHAALSTVLDRRAFRAETDTDWSWREKNCTDKTCLLAWYASRTEELKRALGLSADQATWRPARECTTASEGLTAVRQCDAALSGSSRWHEDGAHSTQWFCAVAAAQ